MRCALFGRVGTRRSSSAGGSGFLVNDLAELVEFLIKFDLGTRQALLADIDGVRKQRAAFLDFLRVTARLELESLGLQEPVQILIKFVFFQSFHKKCLTEGKSGAEVVGGQLQIPAWFVASLARAVTAH